MEFVLELVLCLVVDLLGGLLELVLGTAPRWLWWLLGLVLLLCVGLAIGWVFWG